MTRWKNLRHRLCTVASFTKVIDVLSYAIGDLNVSEIHWSQYSKLTFTDVWLKKAKCKKFRRISIKMRKITRLRQSNQPLELIMLLFSHILHFYMLGTYYVTFRYITSLLLYTDFIKTKMTLTFLDNLRVQKLRLMTCRFHAS